MFFQVGQDKDDIQFHDTFQWHLSGFATNVFVVVAFFFLFFLFIPVKHTAGLAAEKE